jgi:hypothetical protein
LEELLFYKDIKYAENISPYLFKNSKVEKLGLYELSETYIRTNRISFENGELKQGSLNGTEVYFPFEYLQIDVYNYNLDERLLNRFLFKNIYSLLISGHLAHIHRDTFRIFKSIRVIIVKQLNIRDFYRRHLRTLYVLNEDVHFNYESKQMIQNVKDYKDKQIKIYFAYQQDNLRGTYNWANISRK